MRTTAETGKARAAVAAERGRDAILTAAARVFAQKGFGEARVDEIAACAGVNKAMLYYHVGGKDDLYAAVVARVLDGVAERLAAVLASKAPPEERFRALVAAVGDAARDVPEFPVLILREVADGGTHLPPAVLHRIANVFEAFRSVLADGKAAGVFGGADPLLTHMIVGGSLVFLAASRPLRERLEALEPLARRRRAPSPPHAVADLLLYGLTRPQRPKGARK
jgi:AcrR family transcriptional regulator